MANELYRATDPDDAGVTLTFDSGIVVTGIPGEYEMNGMVRGDAKMLPVPLVPEASGGAVLTVTREGFYPFSARAVFSPNPDGPSALDIDDITLTPIPTAPPDPGPQPPDPDGPTNPLDRINMIYSSGQFNLVNKQGCGEFTEAVAQDFALFYGLQWGHVFKTPGQNQWNKHAVDAIHCLYGENDGIWDIIYSSASTSARPVFNRAGDAKPDLWRPFKPIPCQDGGKKRK